MDNCGRGWKVGEMARSRRTKIPAEEKTRLVLAVLANEIEKWRKVIKDSKIPPPT